MDIRKQLYTAAQKGDLEYLRNNLHTCNVDINQLLQTAVTYDRLETVKFLIEHGANDVECVELLCRNGNYELLCVIMKMTNEIGNEEWLEYAIKSNNYNIVKLLLDSNPNMELNDALSTACIYGHDKIAELLIDYGTNNLNECLYYYGRHVTSYEIAELLINRGATNLDICLEVALSLNKYDNAVLLLQKGAKLTNNVNIDNILELLNRDCYDLIVGHDDLTDEVIELFVRVQKIRILYIDCIIDKSITAVDWAHSDMMTIILSYIAYSKPNQQDGDTITQYIDTIQKSCCPNCGNMSYND